MHHPNLDATLLDQVLIKFYWLREQSDLRKKPSTSELIDWISALLRAGISHDQLEAHIPFIGALLKKEQDARGAAALRRQERPLPHHLERARPPLQSVGGAPRRCSSTCFYGLRDEGVPVAMQEWMTLLEALKRGMHGSSLLRFYHLARACLVKSETYFDAYDRVFARVFKGVEGAFDDVTDDVLEVAAGPQELPRTSRRRSWPRSSASPPTS